MARSRPGHPAPSTSLPTLREEDQKRRKQTEYAKSFEFVGGASGKEANASMRRRMKQLVMHDYIQKKRARTMLINSQLDGPQPLPFPWIQKVVEPGDFPKPFKPDTHACEPLFIPPRRLGSPLSQAVELVSRSRGKKGEQLPALVWDVDPELPDQVPQEFMQHLPGAVNPQTFLGAARTDPFASYPFECGRIEHQIIDFRKSAIVSVPHAVTPRF